ncbi:hypothetical protein LEQ_1158 [Ligilactobacillus equi DPC 6820]|uniref:Uncharacterized protein n=2 Tax=Ligilactobacillus equi TaxID=137357 RepID=V7I0M5_9LACO|nr:hypothetical protein LEQ_1158 [Ligilactobacillus equi DPC 6820]
MTETFQDSAYKEKLSQNFQLIEEALNEIESTVNDSKNQEAKEVTREYVDEEVKKLNNRIKFITVTGIDETVVRDVVDKILKEKGVI